MQQVFDVTYTTSLVDLHLEYLRDCVRTCVRVCHVYMVYVRTCVCVCVCVCRVCMVRVRTCVRVLILLVFKIRLPDRYL